MQARQSDCAIERALSDPMTAAIMRADGVDPAALRQLLRDAAAQVPRRPTSRIVRAARTVFCQW